MMMMMTVTSLHLQKHNISVVPPSGRKMYKLMFDLQLYCKSVFFGRKQKLQHQQ